MPVTVNPGIKETALIDRDVIIENLARGSTYIVEIPVVRTTRFFRMKISFFSYWPFLVRISAALINNISINQYFIRRRQGLQIGQFLHICLLILFHFLHLCSKKEMPLAHLPYRTLNDKTMHYVQIASCYSNFFAFLFSHSWLVRIEQLLLVHKFIT